MKDFNPNLLESSSADGEDKKESPNLLQALSCYGQGTQNSFFRDLELSIAKELAETWLVAVDDRQETKDFNPKLFKLSCSDGEEKEDSPDFLQVSSCNCQGTMNSLFRDLELAIAKANKSDVSRSRSERKAETKDFNPKVFELSSSDSEEKEESPDFLQVLPCNGQGTQNSLFRDLELSIAKELTDSWFVPDVKRSGSFTKVGICIRCFENSRDDHGGLKVWEDHGDSSVDKALKKVS